MKNKEFTKVYEGLQSLIRVAMGDSVSNDTYFEYLLFYILTMYGSYRHSSERVNQLSLWESICTNHPFRIDSEDELEWIQNIFCCGENCYIRFIQNKR